MRELKAQPITVESFAPFGSFCSVTEPSGYPLSGQIHKFYPDRVTGTVVGTIAFSPIAVKKSDRIISQMEYHTSSWEGLIPIDDDMIIHVSPASGAAPVVELTKAFIVPKGTFV